MKNFKLSCVSLIAVSILVFTAGCAVTPVIPPRGIAFTKQRAPLFPSAETGRFQGKAVAHNVLFLVGWGDCSIKRAAKNAGITNIKNIDYEMENYFIFYQKFTVIVYGERDRPAGLPR
jgi:hypothetical protein